MSRRIGVCSWSLHPDGPADLARKVRALGLSACSLPWIRCATGEWAVEDSVAAFREAGVEIRSGMMAMGGEDYSTLESIRRTGGVRPDQYWEANLAAADRNAVIASDVGIGLVTFHAGFLPHRRHDPLRKIMVGRLQAIMDRFAGCGVRVAFETGQEEAGTLLDVLDQLDRPEAGVNFDPANMVLYGNGDPVAGLRMLAPRVLQIHVKDAVATEAPGTWGTEVPVGEGQVDWAEFMRVVGESGLDCDLMIEREACSDRLADIRRAGDVIGQFVGM